MILRILQSDWARFASELQARRDVETAGIILAERLRDDVLLARDLIAVPDDGYQIRKIDQIRIDPIALNRLIRTARDRGLSVITVHTHPGADQPWFSHADDGGDARLMPSLFAQMPGPHGSLVIAGDSGIPLARAWSEGGAGHDVNVNIVGQTLQSHPGRASARHGEKWFDRQSLALGEDGQSILRALHVGVVGLGGTGSVAFVQLAHLGIGKATAIDGDRVSESNVSRILGTTTQDAQFTNKVDVAARYAANLGLGLQLRTFPGHLGKEVPVVELESCDIIISCVDKHVPRALLNRLAYERGIPVIDMGSAFRVNEAGHVVAGVGRVVVVGPGRRCLGCWGHIDPDRLRVEALSEAEREGQVAEGYIAGAEVQQPSVVAFNTMIAGAAIVELLRIATGFAGTNDPPQRLSFDFVEGTVRRNQLAAAHECSICTPRGIGKNRGLTSALPGVSSFRRGRRSPQDIQLSLTMKIPLAYLDASVIEEVPIELWINVFDAVGWPSSLKGKRKTLAHPDVLSAFQEDDPTDELLEALEALDMLGTESGREAIVAAMADQRVSTSALPDSMGEREMALRLYLAQRDDAAMAGVFARAHTHSQERAEFRRYNEFVGLEAKAVSRLADRASKLKSLALEYCRNVDLGDHVHMNAFEDDGVYVLHVLRSDRVKKPLAIVEGRKGRATIQYRPVYADILKYESATGRLRIAARSAAMVDFYRSAVGQALFDDEEFFSSDAACSLQVLQVRGKDALEGHGVFGIGNVRMTECVWERGDRDLLTIRSNDCFKSLGELGINLAEGTLLQAKLKLHVFGKSTRPVTVTIRAPSRIEISQKSHEQTVDAFLTKTGIRGKAQSEPTMDLWSLYPWRHASSTWRRVLGAQTDMLVQRGALVAVQLDAIAALDHPGSGTVRDAHAISAGNSYGVSRAPEIPSRSVSSTDLDGLEFDPRKFQEFVRAQLELTGTVVPWDGSELLDLGIVQVGEVQLRLVFAVRALDSESVGRVQHLAGAIRGVLLVPESRIASMQPGSASLRLPLGLKRGVIREIVTSCGLTSEVPALYAAPEAARLVVDSTRGKIWVDGVEITLIKDTHPFRFVEEMARQGPSPLSSSELSKRLSGAREDGNTAARQAKNSARKAIAQALANAGRAPEPDPFPSAGTGCYRCLLPSYVG